MLHNTLPGKIQTLWTYRLTCSLGQQYYKKRQDLRQCQGLKSQRSCARGEITPSDGGMHWSPGACSPAARWPTCLYLAPPPMTDTLVQDFAAKSSKTSSFWESFRLIAVLLKFSRQKRQQTQRKKNKMQHIPLLHGDISRLTGLPPHLNNLPAQYQRGRRRNGFDVTWLGSEPTTCQCHSLYHETNERIVVVSLVPNVKQHSYWLKLIQTDMVYFCWTLSNVLKSPFIL